MTQEQNHRSPTNRRTARPTRNRPVLVTSSIPIDGVTEDQTEQTPGDSNQLAGETSSAQADTMSPSTPLALKPTPTPTGPRKLAGFFSRVGKSTQEETSEADAAQARLARATRGK